MKPWVVKLIIASITIVLILVPLASVFTSNGQTILEKAHSDEFHPEYPSLKLHNSHKAATPEGQIDHNYYGSYATFTEQFDIFNNKPCEWAGDWTERIQRNNYLIDFENRKGLAVSRFEFIPGIRKTLMHLTIYDEVYYDSGRMDMVINLKMSKFNESESTFRINCDKGDEYFALAQLVSQVNNKEDKNYFDMDFTLKFVDKTTKQPLDLRKPNISMENVSISMDIYSRDLGVSLKGEMTYRPLTEKKVFLSWLIICAYFLLMVFTFSSGVFIKESFIPNVGAEVMGIISIFNYHLFVAYLHLSKVSQFYSYFFYVLIVIAFISTFMFTMVTLFYLITEDQYARNLPRGQIRNNCREIYIFLFIITFIILLILMAIFTPKFLFTKSYKYLLFIIFSFPLIQIPLTFFKWINREVFNPSFQIFDWWFNLFPLVLMKGIHNDFTNLSPSKELLYYSITTLIIGGSTMFAQSKFGVYFFLPEDWVPGRIKLKFKVDGLDKEKLEEACSICQSPVKYDVLSPYELVDLGELEADENLLPLAKEIMVTPCKHYFHVNCLRPWLMNRKQTCPMCNASVPYME